MNTVFKHITGWLLFGIFILSGVITALPALTKAGYGQQLAELVENEFSGEREEKAAERETAPRDHHHTLDIEFCYWGILPVINISIDKSQHWPQVYLPVFTPPPDYVA